MQTFAAADIDDVRIRNRNCDRPDRAGRLIIKNRLPGSPEIGRFEDTAIHLRSVKDVRLRGHTTDRARASAAVRTDVPPAQHRPEVLIAFRTSGRQLSEKQGENKSACAAEKETHRCDRFRASCAPGKSDTH